MKRREAVLTIGAMTLAACADPASVIDALPAYPLSINFYICPIWQVPREEYGRVPGIQCPWRSGWDAMHARGSYDRIPAIGEYDEADPVITEYYLSLLRSLAVDGVDISAVYQIEVDHAVVMAKKLAA